MDNGHATATSNNNTALKTNADADSKSTSDVESMEDTVEFRLMMAYAARRRPRGGDLAPPPTPAQTENDVKEKKGGKRKGKKMRLCGLFKCGKPQGGDEEEAREEPDQVVAHCGGFRSLDDQGKKCEVDEVAGRLTKIADEVQLTPPDLETDGEEDEVEKLIGLLLKDAGDRLNQEVLKDASQFRELFGNYSFFERLISTFLSKMGFTTFDPDAPGPQGSPKTQIALTCEVTSRLTAVDTLPMSRLLGFGAKYLQEHYSVWATQQGGYEKAVDDDDEEEEEVQ